MRCARKGDAMSSNKKRYYGPCATVFESGKTGAWRVVRPEFDKAKCILCGICEKHCPTDAITVVKKNQPDPGISLLLDFCKGCGICGNVCPKQAVDMVPEREGL